MPQQHWWQWMDVVGMSEWHIFDSANALDTALQADLTTALKRDIRGRGRASLAVSGGSTPRGLLQQLSHAPLDWAKVDVTLVDERWVDPGSPDSNERLVRETLLCNEAEAANFIGLKSAPANADDGVAEAISRVTRMSQPFSAVVLGMGGDGHTASWFPQAANLQELLDLEASSSVAATEPVTAPHQRITLTMPAVLNTSNLIIHITGNEKREVLESAAERGYPIAAVLSQTTTPVSIWWTP
ncbi:MAG: 6-phosphogluconolactonase [Halieaceae bacterium]|jgi:6-phosphogluconolactonase